MQKVVEDEYGYWVISYYSNGDFLRVLTLEEDLPEWF